MAVCLHIPTLLQIADDWRLVNDTSS